jgi:hypothetical protein
MGDVPDQMDLRWNGMCECLLLTPRLHREYHTPKNLQLLLLSLYKKSEWMPSGSNGVIPNHSTLVVDLWT